MQAGHPVKATTLRDTIIQSRLVGREPAGHPKRMHKMTRIKLLRLPALLGAACSQAPSPEERIEALEDENAGLRAQLSTLQDQLSTAREAAETVQGQASAVQSASEELQSEIGRFDGENWRDVMPDAQRANGEVEDAQSALTTATSDLTEATEQ